MKAQELRNAVLQLAIQGKLMQQNPTDEPASVLLERIRAEKERLIKEKKIKREKLLPEITEEEKPFDIPDSWEWIRLGDLVYDMTGLSYKKDNLNIKSQNMIRVLRGGNIFELAYSFKSDDVFIDKSFVKDGLLLQKNWLITPAVTSVDHIGKMALVEKNYEDTTVGGFVLILKQYCFDDVLAKYLLYSLSSKYHRDNCRNITNKSGQAFYNLSREKLMQLLVGIPPLQEQQRIVAKIEEIMPLIDQYEKLETELSQLEADFPMNLKKSILQYAVKGKLVEQNQEDEPANVLLDKIKVEKEQLIKNKKIKREKPLPEITDEEKPFDLPDSWEWRRLIECCIDIADIDHKMPTERNEGYPYISPVNFTDGNGIDYNNAKKISEIDFLQLSRKCKPEKLDIIFPRYGTIGVLRFIEEDLDFLVSYSCATVKTDKVNTIPKYVYYALQSNLIRNEIERYINKTTQPNVGLQSIKQFLFPLPPLAEQQRIVEKMDKLMALCDILADEKVLSKYQFKGANVINFKPQAAKQEADGKFDMVARAESIKPETQTKIADTLKELGF